MYSQQSLIEEYKNAISVQKQSVKDEQENAVSSVSGIDFSKVDEHDEIAEELLRTVMTWDSYEEYQAIRKKMIDDYKLSKDDTFMTVFLPKIPNKKAKNGKNYNKIDNNGLNVYFEDMKSYVTKISEKAYSYFTIVEWSSSDEAGNEGKSEAVFTYDVDMDGGISNLEGYTIK